jgi:hypothetical protein
MNVQTAGGQPLTKIPTSLSAFCAPGVPAPSHLGTGERNNSNLTAPCPIHSTFSVEWVGNHRRSLKTDH